MSDLQDLTRHLEQAPQLIARRVTGRMIRAQRDLHRIARGIVHVKTGNLRDHLAAMPVYVAADGLQFTVEAPGVSYAGYEVARGGEHDFVARTMEDGGGVIDQAAEDIAEIAAATIVGRG